MQARILISTISLFSLAGCAHRYLHDPQAKALADSAAQHLEAAQLNDLGKQRAAHEELTRQGLAAIRRQYGGMRDLRLVAVLSEPEQAAARKLFQEYVDHDLGKLGAKCDKEASDERLARKSLTNAETTYNLAYAGKTYLSGNSKGYYPPATCEGNYELPAAAEGAAVWNKLREACAALKKAEDARRLCIGTSGEPGRARTELDELRATKAKIAETINKLDGRLSVAYTAYGEAVDKAEKEKVTPEVQKAAKVLQKALAAYDSATPAAGSADKFLAQLGVRGFSAAVTARGVEKRLGILRELLPAAEDATGTTPIGEAAPESAWSKRDRLLLLGAASRVPGLIDQVFALMDQSLLPPLLFEVRRLEVERQRAALDDARMDRAIELLERRVEALETQATLVNQASRMFQRALACTPAGTPDPNAAAVFSGAPAACRENMAGAILLYAQSWTHGLIPAREAEYQLIVLAHDRAIAESELNLRAWHDLIAVPLSQLVAIYSGGISQETVANLVVGIITAAGWAGAIVGSQAVSK